MNKSSRPERPTRLIWCCLVAVLVVGAEARGESEPRQGVVVLTDGQVHAGLVSEVPSGYRVDSGGRFAVFPFYQVRLTAESLPVAYETLRESQRNPSAEDHLLLAEWCLRHELLKQARSEVAAALKLEPLRSDARTLLRRIDARLDPAPEAAPGAELATQRSAINPATFQFRNEQTVSGLSRETYQEYVRRVQPLLMNKCGNARCHGASSARSDEAGSAHRFQFLPVRSGSRSHRQTSERNLAAVLQFINFDAPDQSPLLLTSPESAKVHGEIFRGSAGADQFRLLESWVSRAAREASPPGERRQHRRSADVEMHAVTSLETAVTEPELLPLPKIADGDESPMPERAQDVTDERRLLDRIRQEQLPDPFDPDIFNRRVHGQTARELREQRESGGKREHQADR
jgi:hypothetical protein